MRFACKLMFTLAAVLWVAVMIPSGVIAAEQSDAGGAAVLVAWALMTFGPIFLVGAIGSKIGHWLSA